MVLLKHIQILYEYILILQKTNVCISILKVNDKEQSLKHKSEDKMNQLISFSSVPFSYCVTHLILVAW